MTPSARARGMWLLAIACGCGPDSTEPAELAELCGVDEPVQVLPLRDEEAVAAGYTPIIVARIRDRWLYGVQEFSAPLAEIQEAWSDPGYRIAVQVGARIESVGRCGEDRRTVAEGLDRILPRLGESAPWLGFRSDTSELFWFDPDGRWPARRLARTRYGGWHVVIGRYVFLHRRDESDFVSIELVGDGQDVSTEVLLDDVVDTSPMSFLHQRETALATIFALRGNGELVAVDLEHHTVELVQQGVRLFAAGLDPRWIGWAAGDPNDPSDELARGAWLLDRETGEQHELTLEGKPELVVRFYEHSVVVDGYVDGEAIATRFVDLPGLERIDLTGRWQWFGSSPEGRFAALDVTSPSAHGITIFGPQDGELVALSGPLIGSSTSDGAIVHRDSTPYEDVNFPGNERPHDLVIQPFETLERETIQRRVWSGVALAGDRWADVRVHGPGDHVGTFEVIDGATGHARFVDDDVVGSLDRFEPHADDDIRPWATNELVYQIRDPGSDRTGLWRVRFGE